MSPRRSFRSSEYLHSDNRRSKNVSRDKVRVGTLSSEYLHSDNRRSKNVSRDKVRVGTLITDCQLLSGSLTSWVVNKLELEHGSKIYSQK